MYQTAPHTIDGTEVQVPRRAPAPPPGERWIGPIPNRTLPADTDDHPFRHAGGAAPMWGGYRPTVRNGRVVPHDLDSRATLAPVATSHGGVVLHWYVSAPADRLCERAVKIAMGALHDGEQPATLREMGIRADEIHEAITRRQVSSPCSPSPSPTSPGSSLSPAGGSSCRSSGVSAP